MKNTLDTINIEKYPFLTNVFEYTNFTNGEKIFETVKSIYLNEDISEETILNTIIKYLDTLNTKEQEEQEVLLESFVDSLDNKQNDFFKIEDMDDNKPLFEEGSLEERLYNYTKNILELTETLENLTVTSDFKEKKYFDNPSEDAKTEIQNLKQTILSYKKTLKSEWVLFKSFNDNIPIDSLDLSPLTRDLLVDIGFFKRTKEKVNTRTIKEKNPNFKPLGLSPNYKK